MPIRPDLRPLYKTPEARAAFQACRDRAGNQCQHCGARGGSTYKAECRCDAGSTREGTTCPRCKGSGIRRVRVVMTVAHLDHAPTNNRADNLAHLCAACHLRHDAEHHAESRRAARDARAGQMNFAHLENP